MIDWLRRRTRRSNRSDVAPSARDNIRPAMLATRKIEVTHTDMSSGKSTTRSGSGFHLRMGFRVYFVTNRHIVEPGYPDEPERGSAHEQRISAIRVHSFNTVPDDDQANSSLLLGAIDVLTHGNRNVDLAVLDRGLVSGGITSGNRTGQAAVPEGHMGISFSASVSPDSIADTEYLERSLEWGEPVIFSSYQPWRSAESGRPIVRTGTVASDPAHPYSLANPRQEKLILLEANSYGGSSGSPVFTTRGGAARKLIGVMAGHIANTHSEAGALNREHTSLSYCVRSDALLEMVGTVSNLQRETIELEPRQEVLIDFLKSSESGAAP